MIQGSTWGAMVYHVFLVNQLSIFSTRLLKTQLVIFDHCAFVQNEHLGKETLNETGFFC